MEEEFKRLFKSQTRIYNEFHSDPRMVAMFFLFYVEGKTSSQAQQPPRMQFLDRSKEKIITLLWQGICDGTVEAFDVNGMMVIPSEEGMTYVRKEDAISFFGLVEQSQAQQDETCPECGRKKAKSADDCAAGLCPKWYAIRDKEAAKDCQNVSQAQQPRESNADHVICPACAHGFRAIPENVQSLLISAGFEPPFLSQERQESKILSFDGIGRLVDKAQAQQESLQIGKVQHFAAPEGAPVYVTVQWKGSPPKHGAKVYTLPPASERE